MFHCVHFECPAVSTCTKSLGNNDQDIEERGGSASSQSSASSEGDEISSSTSDNMQDESNFKRLDVATVTILRSGRTLVLFSPSKDLVIAVVCRERVI